VSSVAPLAFTTARSVDAEYREAWQQAHVTVEREHDLRLPLLEGEWPRELRGTLYRNGPARFERGGVRYGHLFDGDGMVAAFTFDDLGVFYRNRWVRTKERDREERQDQVVYRSFGTRPPGDWRQSLLRTRFKNAANTGVTFHAGKLLALWEGGAPHRLDPRSLDTLGRELFAGALLDRHSMGAAMFGRELPFSAHPKLDAVSGELLNFGLRPGPRPLLFLHRVLACGRLLPPARVALDGSWFVHDFALTPRWMVFVLSPVAFRTLPMVTGRLTPAEALQGDPRRPLRVLAVERRSLLRGGAPKVRIAEADDARGFAFHLANAFDDGDEGIVLDAAWTERFPALPCPARPLPALVPPRLVRYHADLSTGRVHRVESSRSLLELPEIDPRFQGVEQRMTWGIGGDPGPEQRLSALVRLERGGADRMRDFAPDIIGPPLFVPKPGAGRSAAIEGEGWLLATLYSLARRRTEILVLDPTTLRVIARAALPHVLPPGFHGTFVPASPHPIEQNPS
jgi:all-trans-8'-apo-beta-carotenal 15,15'-oxygenase